MSLQTEQEPISDAEVSLVLPSLPTLPAPLPSFPRRLAMLLAASLAWLALYFALPTLASRVTYRLFGLPRASHLSAAVEFFLFEVPKLLLLLIAVVFVVGIIHTFVTPERTRRLLAGSREAAGYPLAAALGVVTPFCSCSAVPLFIGFVTAGVPLGVTFTFLIAAPMVNEVALVLLFGLFGWRVAGLYLMTGLAVAMVAGALVGRLRMENGIEEWVWNVQRAGGSDEDMPKIGWADRLDRAAQSVREIVGKVWPYLVVGIAVGAGIHGYVPTDFVASFMGRSAWWSVPLAVIVGVPMYSNAAGIIPVVQALLSKGAALGTTLAFMMAVIGLSLPEVILLRRVLKVRLIATFVAVVASGILIVGYLFNALL